MAKMTDEELAKYIKSAEAKKKPISMRQARIQLHRVGVLVNVDAILSANEEMKIAWEYSTYLERNNNLVISMGQQLNMSDEQLDDLFIAAQQIGF